MKINCLCDGIGFPYGEATNNRIIMVGKALMAEGNSFHVYVNCKRSRNLLNKKVKGEFENIYFEHLNRSVKLDLPLWRNAINYFLIGFFNTFLLIHRLSKKENNAIYLYSHGTLFNMYVSLLAFVFGVPVIQEVNEWTEEVENDFFTAFVYKSVMFRWAKGTIAISENIIKELEKQQEKGQRFDIFYLPVLADKKEWQLTPLQVERQFTWCGLVDGYINDVFFLIKALSIVNEKYSSYKLIICGKYKQATKERIIQLIRDLNMSPENVLLTGYISDEQLKTYCKTATALLSPLWEDQRSAARFPTKIASFLYSSRPVITCEIGEVGKILTHQENALFYKPGNDFELAEKMIYMIENSQISNQIGLNGRKLAEDKFDFRSYGEGLNSFFNKMMFSKSNPLPIPADEEVEVV